MIKKIKEIYKPDYMNRPLVYKCWSKVIYSLVLCLAWNRFVNDGSRGVDFIFSVAAILFFIHGWFCYLKLDGVTVGHLMQGWGSKAKKNTHWNKDIADFVDEEVVDFSELDDDEKDVIQFLSSLIVAALYLVATVGSTLF